MADAVTNTAEQLIDAFLREFGPLLQPRAGAVAQGGPVAAATPRRRALHFYVPSGAYNSWTADADAWLLGAFDVYSNRIVTVSTDGTGQNELVSGANFRALPGMLVGSDGAATADCIYNRVFVPMHQVLTISINSGPAIVVLVFEPI